MSLRADMDRINVSLVQRWTLRLLPLLAFGCDPDAEVDPQDDAQVQRAPLPKADGAGSCEGSDVDHCGGKSPGSCYCDEACTTHGDCCSDYEPVCLDEEPAPQEPAASVVTAEDLFASSSWCTGSGSFTRSDARDFFAPGSFVSGKLQDFGVHRRIRACNAATGCGSWSYGEGSSPLDFRYTGVTWTPSGGHYWPASATVQLPATPTVSFRVVDEDIRLIVTSGPQQHQNSWFDVGFGCDVGTINGHTIGCESGARLNLEGQNNITGDYLTWRGQSGYASRLRGTANIDDECFYLRLQNPGGTEQFVIYGEWE